MVLAILAGTKTQTRRIVNPQPKKWIDQYSQSANQQCWIPSGVFISAPCGFLGKGKVEIRQNDLPTKCPYGAEGDRLWVRETWQHENAPDGLYSPGWFVAYRADYMSDPHGPDGEKSPEGKYRTWRPSIFMPRAASRITLAITGVRVERLQAISRGDAMAEGCPFPNLGGGECGATDPVGWYRGLWSEINGAGSWDENPWVWVIDFTMVTG